MTTFNDEDGGFKEKWNIYLKINADKISEVFSTAGALVVITV